MEGKSGLLKDDVCCVKNNEAVVYGLVLEDWDSISSDDEACTEASRTNGSVGVCWHPSGKVTNSDNKNMLMLVDRSLMVADVVQRISPQHQSQRGLIQDLHVRCHLQISGTAKYICDVDSRHLSPCVQMQKYDTSLVAMDNWIGEVNTVEETVVLSFADGARCEVKDTEISYFDDVSEKRSNSSSYNEEYYYPGQRLKGELSSLDTATWLRTTKLHNQSAVRSKNDTTVRAVVEKVNTVCVHVNWACHGYCQASINSDMNTTCPPLSLTGENLSRLHLVDKFEHCQVKLGDKMFYTIKEGDSIGTQTPHHSHFPCLCPTNEATDFTDINRSTEELLSMVADGTSHHDPGPLASENCHFDAIAGTRNNRSANELECQVTSGDNPCPAAIINGASLRSSNRMLSASSIQPSGDVDHDELPVCSSHSQSTGLHGEGERGTDADDEYDEKDGVWQDDDVKLLSRLNVSSSQRKQSCCHSNPCRGKKRPFAANTRFVPGMQVATEVCCTFTCATILWQDGQLEKMVPSVELCPLYHLDDHDFLPGMFVIDNKAESPSLDYGLVVRCDHAQRTCTVKWFQEYQTVSPETVLLQPTEVIRRGEVSVFEIQEHPHYKFRPGLNVIRVSGFKLSDYSNSSFDSDSFTDSDTETDTDSSWTTEGENGGTASFSDEQEWTVLSDGDEEHCDNVDKAGDVARLIDLRTGADVMERILEIESLFQIFSIIFMTVTFYCDDILLTSKCSELKLASRLFKLLKAHRECRKVDKLLNTCYFSAIYLKSLVTSIKLHMKRMRASEMKKQFDHVFVASNKGLLKKSTAGDLDTSPTAQMGDFAACSCDESSALRLCKGSKINDQGVTTCEHRQTSDDVVEASMEGVCVSPARVGEETEHVCSCDFPSDIRHWIDGGTSETFRVSFTDQCQLEFDFAGIKYLLDCITIPDSRCLHFCSALLSTHLKIKQEGVSVASEAVGSTFLSVGTTGGSNNVLDARSEVTRLLTSILNMSKETILNCLTDLAITISRTVLQYFSHADLSIGHIHSQTSAADVGVNSGVEGVGNGEENGRQQGSGGVGDVVLPVSDEMCPYVGNSAVVGSGACHGEVFCSETGECSGFYLCNDVPCCHTFFSRTYEPTNPKAFYAALRRELKLLQSSLPKGIIVKGFEDRMDLLSVLIDGPVGTPYEDCVFLFDVCLPQDYPLSPPLLHYLSFSGDRLNPNLYVDGKVCVSLLGTWYGKGKEMWTSESNLLQVLVSIQGLILVDEPYYNEAGYHKQRGQRTASENSRMYNETVLLRVVESMARLCEKIPHPFQLEIKQRLQRQGPRRSLGRLMTRLRLWISNADIDDYVEHMLPQNLSAGCHESTITPDQDVTDVEASCSSVSSQDRPGFLLLPISKGFVISIQMNMAHLETSLKHLEGLNTNYDAAHTTTDTDIDTSHQRAA